MIIILIVFDIVLLVQDQKKQKFDNLKKLSEEYYLKTLLDIIVYTKAVDGEEIIQVKKYIR